MPSNPTRRERKETTEEAEETRRKKMKQEEKIKERGGEDKIIYAEKCKIRSTQYNEIKRELEQKRKEYKNKRITQITAEIRQSIRQGDTMKVWQRLNEMEQNGGTIRGGGISLKNDKGEIKTECGELLKIMENAIKGQFYTNQKRGKGEMITKEEWRHECIWRQQTEKNKNRNSKREGTTNKIHK